ncbi:uncharacterized protein [Triticum aestivum]|uniref:uncharacterized protein n=1 Tax=Triticum aestivum TaxID=4565 RepID=UPI001D00BAC4|nr:uncharacterized protein LOC123046859 [Triticum aestivum]XP_044326229.1 uncharacterized protein LOC123046859 [Triticum aestivum]
MKQYSSSQFARMLKIAVWCLTSPEKHFSEVRHDTQINLTLRTRWWLHCITRSRECDARLVVSMGEQLCFSLTSHTGKSNAHGETTLVTTLYADLDLRLGCAVRPQVPRIWSLMLLLKSRAIRLPQNDI